MQFKRHIPRHPPGACVLCDAVAAKLAKYKLDKQLKESWIHSPHAFVMRNYTGGARVRRCTCGRLESHPYHRVKS